ncbi:MAG: UDP-glucose 4-epimerase GalE, partial [Rhodobacteraceae bacterium]
MRVLVTGGAGYIGSHTLLQLLRADHDVLVYDNFINSAPEALARVQNLTNRPLAQVTGDIRDSIRLNETFAQFRPEAVIHFAGLKSVGNSVQRPLSYYDTNVAGTLQLLRAMSGHGCDRIVFSSSATVYGEAICLPYDEDHPLQPASPYGRSKMMAEMIIRDWAARHSEASAVLLRYFNPVGADASGRIGEDPTDIPENLMPYVAQVAVGTRDALSVYGADYPTGDGTGERDYIHVDDLARAHCAALDYAARTPGCEAINVGTGTSVSVLQMVAAFERASGRRIPYRVVPRRAGDVARMCANVEKAQRLLGWQAQMGLEEMCRSTWAWQSANPAGYRL